MTPLMKWGNCSLARAEELEPGGQYRENRCRQASFFFKPLFTASSEGTTPQVSHLTVSLTLHLLLWEETVKRCRLCYISYFWNMKSVLSQVHESMDLGQCNQLSDHTIVKIQYIPEVLIHIFGSWFPVPGNHQDGFHRVCFAVSRMEVGSA